MALSLRLQSSPVLPKTSLRPKQSRVIHNLSPSLTTVKKKQRLLVLRAVEEGKESSEELKTVEEAGVELSELGSEIKKALQERKKEKEGDFASGVAEEIREIEWPPFGKVLGTTGVVLGIIAGSSVVLLTVNFLLAELSDRVFAGRGVQDFFG